MDLEAPGTPRIPAAILAELVEIDHFWSFAPLAWTWAIIIATAYLQTRFGSWLTLPIALVFIARSQHALAILMHEGAHARLAKSRRINDLAGAFLAGYPVLISLHAYRRVHITHHKDPLAPTDPDLVLTSGYPVTRATLVRRLARDLAGISFFKVLSYVITGVTRRARRTARIDQRPSPLNLAPRDLAGIAFVHAILFGACALLQHPEVYFLLWMLPLMTVLQVMLRLRGLADHAALPEPTPDAPLPQHMRTRTVLSNPIARFFLAPLDVGFHLEHHLYVGLPWYRLRDAHRVLGPQFVAAGAPIEKGYWAVFRRLIA